MCKLKSLLFILKSLLFILFFSVLQLQAQLDESFESIEYDGIPNNWQRVGMEQGVIIFNGVITEKGFPDPTTNCYELGRHGDFINVKYDYLITPSITITETNNQFSFWVSRANNVTIFYFGISETDNIDDFTWHRISFDKKIPTTLENPEWTNGWDHVTYNISEYAGETKYFAFRTETELESVVNIDEIHLNHVDCHRPRNLTLSSLQVDSVNLSWIPGGDETTWEIKWGPEGFTPDFSDTSENYLITSPTSTENFTLNIPVNTQFDVYVRAVCGTNSYSEISNRVRVYTKPENDDCSDAIEITQEINTNIPSQSYTVRGWCGSATESNISPDNCTTISLNGNDVLPIADDDVWFSFTALTESMNIRPNFLRLADIPGSGLIFVFEVYSETCGNLSFIDCGIESDDENFKKLLTLENMTVGEKYYLRIYTFNGAEIITTESGQTFTEINNFLSYYSDTDGTSDFRDMRFMKEFDLSIWSNVATAGLQETNFSISFLPNPVTDILHVAISEPIDIIRIYNYLGQKMEEYDVNQQEIDISMKNYSTGIYFIEIQSGNRKKQLKIIKK